MEVRGGVLKLRNPRTRRLQNEIRNLSPSFAIAEWLWCMQGSDELDLIQFYAPGYARFSDDGRTLHGAYGPRIRAKLAKVITLLRDDADSQRAVIPIYGPQDVGLASKDIPCTSSLQFLIRNGCLDMFVHMR